VCLKIFLQIVENPCTKLGGFMAHSQSAAKDGPNPSWIRAVFVKEGRGPLPHPLCTEICAKEPDFTVQIAQFQNEDRIKIDARTVEPPATTTNKITSDLHSHRITQ
jgi:hypothetical protein